MDSRRLLDRVKEISSADLIGTCRLNGHKALVILYRDRGDLDLSWVDEKVVEASKFLAKQGFPSNAVDSARKGTVDLRALANRSGLGFKGKNDLLINPSYGPRIRLSAIITDAPIDISTEENEDLCGDCRQCLDACPTGAAESKDPSLCIEKTNNGNKARCDLCIESCPIGREEVR